MNISQSVLPAKPMKVRSFGPGGQIYISDLFTGFDITTQQVNPLFTFAETDTAVANAAILTNLREPAKIGSTMEFKAVQIGVRVFKITAGAATADEMQAAKTLLASAKIIITYGSNETRVGEFSGHHFGNPVDCVGTIAAGGVANSGAVNSTGWIALPEPIALQKNINLGGQVKFGASVPAALTATANSWGFVVILSGVKAVKG